jgi:FixJ family two-component response regulator
MILGWDLMHFRVIALNAVGDYVLGTRALGSPKLPQRSVIAVVDDDESVREAVAGLLKSFGYLAVPFERAEDFLNSSHLDHTACLIADVQMPEMTGLELQLRLVASGKPIPTILITAYPEQTARAQALQNGARCYLAKPFQDEELLSCVRSAID